MNLHDTRSACSGLFHNNETYSNMSGKSHTECSLSITKDKELSEHLSFPSKHILYLDKNLHSPSAVLLFSVVLLNSELDVTKSLISKNLKIYLNLFLKKSPVKVTNNKKLKKSRQTFKNRPIRFTTSL